MENFADRLVCAKCKVILRAGANFCDNCGTPASEDALQESAKIIVDNIQYLHVSYDFIDNGNGELMMIMDAPEDGMEADDENAKFIFDGFSEAMLVRNGKQIVHLPILKEPVRDMLDELETLLITEMDGEEIADVYEAKIEIINDSLPVPKEVYERMTTKDEKTEPKFASVQRSQTQTANSGLTGGKIHEA
jgi:hypothetical protein